MANHGQTKFTTSVRSAKWSTSSRKDGSTAPELRKLVNGKWVYVRTATEAEVEMVADMAALQEEVETLRAKADYVSEAMRLVVGYFRSAVTTTNLLERCLRLIKGVRPSLRIKAGHKGQHIEAADDIMDQAGLVMDEMRQKIEEVKAATGIKAEPRARTGENDSRWDQASAA